MLLLLLGRRVRERVVVRTRALDGVVLVEYKLARGAEILVQLHLVWRHVLLQLLD